MNNYMNYINYNKYLNMSTHHFIPYNIYTKSDDYIYYENEFNINYLCLILFILILFTLYNHRLNMVYFLYNRN